jgi:hypothetical protein
MTSNSENGISNVPESGGANSASPASSLGWRLFRWVCRRYLTRFVRKILRNRAFTSANSPPMRWLNADIERYIDLLKIEIVALYPFAQLERQALVGNRIMVELAVMTIAAYRVLVSLGIDRREAELAVADIGWCIYAGQLRLASLPFRLTSRDPAKRLQRTISLLLRFPFTASGAPGYAVKSWKEDGNIYTHFTHCPPHTFVRDLIAEKGDGGELQAFIASWCQYDWPGADVIANDGQRGHYYRGRTLSAGDNVCDMCWKGRADGKTC